MKLSKSHESNIKKSIKQKIFKQKRLKSETKKKWMNPTEIWFACETTIRVRITKFTKVKRIKVKREKCHPLYPCYVSKCNWNIKY